MKRPSLVLLLGAALGVLSGLMVGWAIYGHGLLVNAYALKWAGFGAIAGGLTGLVLERLRQPAGLNWLMGLIFGASLGGCLWIGAELSIAPHLPEHAWAVYVASGGLLGLLVGWPGIANDMFRSPSENTAAVNGRLWAAGLRGAALGGIAGMATAALLIARVTSRMPGQINGSLDHVWTYYGLVPLGAVVGMGCAVMQARAHRPSPPDDILVGLTGGGLGTLLVFGTMFTMHIVDRFEQGTWTPDIAVFYLGVVAVIMSIFITLFSVALSVLTEALVPADRAAIRSPDAIL